MKGQPVIEIGTATAEHATALATLCAEMNAFFGERENPAHERIRQITDALSGPNPAATVLLAWDRTDAVGLASYSFLWPAAGVTRSLYLKELYVAEAYRGGGIGEQFMRRLHAIAEEHGCSRIELTTESSSVAAQRFYERLGLRHLDTKKFYRLELPGSAGGKSVDGRGAAGSGFPA